MTRSLLFLAARYHSASASSVLLGDSRDMHIAFVASECGPFSKTGGLADVVGALPRALAAAGHEISIYLPRYRLTRIPEERMVVQSITVPFDDQYRFCSILTGAGYPGVHFYFVD